MTPAMTNAKRLAALHAILVQQNIIRDLFDPNPSPEWAQRVTKDLEDPEGAYAAISAIENVD